MGLLEDLSSGKYNLILFGILFIFIFNQYWNKNNESMADVATLTEDKIKELIYKKTCLMLLINFKLVV